MVVNCDLLNIFRKMGFLDLIFVSTFIMVYEKLTTKII